MEQKEINKLTENKNQTNDIDIEINKIEKEAKSILGDKQFQSGNNKRRWCELNHKILELLDLFDNVSTEKQKLYVKLWKELNKINTEKSEMQNIINGLLAEKAVKTVLQKKITKIEHSTVDEDLEDIDLIYRGGHGKELMFGVQLTKGGSGQEYVNVNLMSGGTKLAIEIVYNGNGVETFFNKITGEPTKKLENSLLREINKMKLN